MALVPHALRCANASVSLTKLRYFPSRLNQTNNLFLKTFYYRAKGLLAHLKVT